VETFEIAHINEQRTDLIIVFVAARAASLSSADMDAFVTALTICARSARLAGHVVPVWPGGFFAPPNVHTFFESAPYALLAQRVNKKLQCKNL